MVGSSTYNCTLGPFGFKASEAIPPFATLSPWAACRSRTRRSGVRSLASPRDFEKRRWGPRKTGVSLGHPQRYPPFQSDIGGTGSSLGSFGLFRPSEAPFVVSAADIAIADLDEGKDIPTAGRDGYGLPQCERCAEPEYSDEGFQAKVRGWIELQIVIGVDGRAHRIALIKGLGHGLDEQAIKAALGWRFKPANGPDGKPAAVQMRVQMTFHLY